MNFNQAAACPRVLSPEGADASLEKAQDRTYAGGLSAVWTALTGAALIVGAFVRWHGLASQSLWFDEGYTVWLSQFPPKEIWRGLQTDTSPPLYYLLQHVWIHWFGISEASLRGLSAFFETLSLPIFYLLAKKVLVDKRATTMATLLFALCAFQIEYAREARFYALLPFFSLASVYSVIVFLEKRSILSFCCLVLSLAAGLYTHNMMLFYLPGMALLWLTYPSARNDRFSRGRLMSGLFVVVIVLVLYSPWIPSLRRQTRTVQSSFWISKPRVGSVLESISVLSGLMQDPASITGQGGGIAATLSFQQRLAGDQSERQLVEEADSVPSVWKARVLHCLCATIFASCVLGGILHAGPFDREKSAALFGYSFLPILLAFIMSRVTQPVYLNRAFIATSATIPILFVAPMVFQSRRWRKVFLFVNVIVMLTIAMSLFAFLRHSQKEDWRGMTDYTIRKTSDRRLVLFTHNLGQILFDYYSAKKSTAFPRDREAGLPTTIDLSVPNIPPVDALSDERLIAPIRDATESKQYNEIDAVFSHSSDRVSRGGLEYFGSHCSSVSQTDFSGISVVQCDLLPAR